MSSILSFFGHPQWQSLCGTAVKLYSCASLHNTRHRQINNCIPAFRFYKLGLFVTAFLQTLLLLLFVHTHTINISPTNQKTPKCMKLYVDRIVIIDNHIYQNNRSSCILAFLHLFFLVSFYSLSQWIVGNVTRLWIWISDKLIQIYANKLKTQWLCLTASHANDIINAPLPSSLDASCLTMECGDLMGGLLNGCRRLFFTSTFFFSFVKGLSWGRTTIYK